ncbi:N-acetyltransferase family protein [Jiulongibacter sp. NS-SX5]|uniref:N-acetyltransferase family protein n=1 Tax=Jiulongibacter sp. NS-SX5 TaxID=3463854 RepID=UPI00405A1514
MEQKLAIREATLDDLPILLPFEQAIITAERPFDQTLKPDPINYYDIGELIVADNSVVMVAELNDEIVGSGYAQIRDAKSHLKHDQYAYLGFMYVDSTARGQGINGKVLQALKDWTADQGLSEIRLEVYSQNEPAIRAYQKAGFSNHLIQMRINLDDET